MPGVGKGSPVTCLKYLGIKVDSVEGVSRLPMEVVLDLGRDLH